MPPGARIRRVHSLPSATQNPFITTVSLPSATISVAYSTTLAANGGTGVPYAWAVSTGTLPTGLSLNSSTGVISGTPSSAGAVNFTISCTDTASHRGTRDFSLTVASTSGPHITTTSLPSGTVSVAYSQALAVTGGASPYTWSVLSGTLPTSLTLSSGGLVSGTPSVAGSFSFTVKVTDNVAATDTYSYTVNVVTSGSGLPPSATPDKLVWSGQYIYFTNYAQLQSMGVNSFVMQMGRVMDVDWTNDAGLAEQVTNGPAHFGNKAFLGGYLPDITSDGAYFDVSWTTITTKWQQFAACAKRHGWKGIGIDPEYHPWWTTASMNNGGQSVTSNTGLSVATKQADAQARGVNIGTAIVAGYGTGVEIRIYLPSGINIPGSYNEHLEHVVNGGAQTADAQTTIGTFGYFLKGFASVSGFANIVLIDAEYYRAADLLGSDTWQTALAWDMGNTWLASNCPKTYFGPFGWIDGGDSQTPNPESTSDAIAQFNAFHQYNNGVIANYQYRNTFDYTGYGACFQP